MFEINITVILSFISAVLFAAAAVTLLTRWRASQQLRKGALIPLIISIFLYNGIVVSNFLEHSGITNYFDPLEDFAEIVFTLVFLFFVNSWRKERSETLFKELFQLAHMPLIEVSRKGKIIRTNDIFIQKLKNDFDVDIKTILTIDDFWGVLYPYKKERDEYILKFYDAVELARKSGTLIPPKEIEVQCANTHIATFVIGASIIDENLLISMTDITVHKRQQTLIERSQKEENVIGELLQFSLRSRELYQYLENSIRVIVTETPWLSSQEKGGIFLVNPHAKNRLILAASYNFDENMKDHCSTVPFGRCLCGRSAQRKESIYKSCIDAEHEITYEGIEEHGHYIVPIKAEDTLDGVLVVYIDNNHSAYLKELQFLERVSNILGIAIQRFQFEEEIAYKAYHDDLTNLPNRQLFKSRLDKEASTAQRYNRYGALLFIDLDNFKIINDIKGHAVGDQFLVDSTVDILDVLREEDTLARVGGDEFVVLLPATIDSLEESGLEARHVAEKIRTKLDKIVHLKGDDIAVSCTIGIVLIDGAGNSCNSETLMARAHTAMFEAKKSGRNQYLFFEDSMQETIDKSLKIEAILRESIHNQYFEVYYQPQVSSEKKLMGAEALVRLNHPVAGWISPSEFIPIAESSGLIREIDYMVLSKVIKDLQLYANKKKSSASVLRSICVNISAKTFEQPDFIDNVKAIISETDVLSTIPIAIELTERIIINDLTVVTEKVIQIKELGFKVSIDDFGTGYSSLSYLTTIPFDILKIDIAFVRDIHLSKRHSAVASSILAMSEALGLHCIAEGVEVNDEFNLLVKEGCPAYQGYLFYKPMPFSEFIRLV